MKLTQLLASASIVATLPFAAQADSAENKAFVLEALENTLLAGDVEAVDQYFSEDIIQHNEMFASGIEAQKGVVGFLAGSGTFKADYVRVIADDDIVAVHARYEGFGETAMIAFDVFRVEDGKIAEHWDNLIPEAAPNPSGRTQIDGATEITDLDKTEANKALVEEFITKSLIEHAEVNITDYISPVTYIQHNPMVADGLEGFGAFMAQMAEQGISMDYTQVNQVIGEGNFVLTLSEGALGGEPTAFYDLFRVEDGLIVEHWDVIAPMPGPDAPHNEAGKF
ncbi:nuclear transport factor 2 family protein [Marinovum sp. 2_MG-2023]|uniref:nuclear transport factor 2 family protein n=1 Tax=Roseobacteraceae TaxID=2854170 RepID=UPI001FD39563|nr:MULTISPECIES: nuclear transport factor 2 family protein [Roseobacteraceae]MCJ7873423.1 nuclear transport factor 2 family protein [Phaeobacter sp. J2-8]MDO6732155.1 nuclear transport factor 2 family protein [Marinovum sp. 2_MG-2023]MDO6781472.1 nuclear transport factor 2 family protein [Marinovum sp. 1_MG-2023]